MTAASLDAPSSGIRHSSEPADVSQEPGPYTHEAHEPPKRCNRYCLPVRSAATRERQLVHLTLHHRTIYRYREPVQFGPHRPMQRPRESCDLRLLSSALAMTPEAAVT